MMVGTCDLTQSVATLRGRLTHVLRHMDARTPARAVIAAEVLMVCALAAIAARLAWTLFSPPAWSPAEITPVAARPRYSASSSLLTQVDPFHRTPAAGATAAPPARAPETMLDLQLFGIRAGKAGSGGSAIVATPDNIQGVFHVGQEIMPGVRLEQVFPDRIVIRRNGVSESLSFDRVVPDSPAAPATVEAAAVTPPAEEPRARIALDVARFASAIRLVPQTRNDTRGLVVEGSTDAGLLHAAGLEAGDMIFAVNGLPVTDTAALAGIAAGKPASLALDIERNGQRKLHRIAIDR